MLAAVLRPTQSPEGLPPPPDLGARLRRSALRGLVICALAVAVVWLSYGGSFAWIEVPEGRFAGTRVPAYLRSFFFVNAANASGRATYFLGEIGADGSPAFFPLAFTIKEPIAFLGLLLAAVISLGWRRGRLGLFVGIPSAVFGVILVAWLQVPMGYRYALPLLPLFCVFIATQLVPAAPRLPRGALVAACVVLFAEGAWIHPHYLAFFNGLAGGPAGGHRFLLESNLDWGQDVETLARYLEERGQPPVWLALFSAERLQQLGVSGRPVRGCKPVGGLLAISRNVRHGLYAPNHLLARATPGCFDWLDAHEPVAHLGYSILVYELPADAPPGGGTARR